MFELEHYIQRKLEQIEPRPAKGSTAIIKEFSSYFDSRVVVVLGEPGLGKTKLLEDSSEKEPDSIYVRIGEFLSQNERERFSGKTLYLDGLDEHRSRVKNIDVMDEIISLLKELGCPKVRISCRNAEWNSGKDLNVLSAVSGSESPVLLELHPLTREEITSIETIDSIFIDQAYEEGLEAFLENPQDLILLYNFYLENAGWPENRRELMEKASELLIKEFNTEHSESIDDSIQERELISCSDYIAAILLLSNVEGVSSSRLHSSQAYPCIQQFDREIPVLKAAVRRKVFRTDSQKRVVPKHRKIAEFMAARYLAVSVRQGLPLSRIMALMTGFDGGISSDLRGVYGWMVTLLSGYSDMLLSHDPVGAIVYGDPFTWTPFTKKKAFEFLTELSRKNPYFLEGNYREANFGGLSDFGLEEEYRAVLSGNKCSTHLELTVLNILIRGKKNCH